MPQFPEIYHDQLSLPNDNCRLITASAGKVLTTVRNSYNVVRIKLAMEWSASNSASLEFVFSERF